MSQGILADWAFIRNKQRNKEDENHRRHHHRNNDDNDNINNSKHTHTNLSTTTTSSTTTNPKQRVRSLFDKWELQLRSFHFAFLPKNLKTYIISNWLDAKDCFGFIWMLFVLRWLRVLKAVRVCSWAFSYLFSIHTQPLNCKDHPSQGLKGQTLETHEASRNLTLVCG